MNNTQNDFISGIGNTPLIKLRAASEITGCNIYGKAEFLNPGGSVKDRAALSLIKDAQEKKLIAKGGTVVEGTAGNTGIGVGLLGNSLGYKTIIVMNDNQTQEKKDLLRNLGAELRLVPPKPYKDDGNYVKVAGRLAEELKSTNNNGVVWANQFDNTANAEGHYETTGPEIWEQTDGKVDGFVCASGTGGTIGGVSKFLKEKNNDVKIIGVDAYGSILKKYHETGEIDPNEIYSYRIEGLGKNIVPSATDFKIIDKFVKVTDSDSAHMAREITLNEGLFVGYTSGAAFQAVKILNDENEFDDSSYVVIVFPDHGSRYLSKIYSDEWMNNQGFYDSSFYQPKKNSINYI